MSERSAAAILQDSFLEVRAKLIEVAATLDRIDHAESSTGPASPDSADTQTPVFTADDSERRARIDAAIRILLDGGDNRARDLQLLFSRDYDPDWRSRMQV